MHYAGLIPDFGLDINDDFDEDFLDVPMVFNTEGHYGFLYPRSGTPPRPTRRDYFLNRLLDLGSQPLHVHIPNSRAHANVPPYHRPIVSPLFNLHPGLPNNGTPSSRTMRPHDSAPYAHSMVGDAHPASIHRPSVSHQGIGFRRGIYEHNRWVRVRAGTIFPSIHPSPEYFRSDPTVIARVTPWLQREVFALLASNHPESHVSVVLNAILSFVYRFDIQSREFRHCVSSYFGSRTAHFQHEFYNFVLSGMRLDEYDYHSVYGAPPTPPVTRRSPPPVIHLDMSPVERVNASIERDVTGHSSVTVPPDHNYATPSPTSTYRRALDNDHNYTENVNTRSPVVPSSRAAEYARQARHAALREFAGARTVPAVSRCPYVSQMYGSQGVPRTGCRIVENPCNPHPGNTGVCTQPHRRLCIPLLTNTRPTGNPSGVVRPHYGCCPSSQHRPRMQCGPPVSCISHPNLTPTSQSRTVPGSAIQDNVFGVMYAPIGVHMVSPHRPTPEVLFVPSDRDDSRLQSAPVMSSRHQHTTIADVNHYPRNHGPVDFPISHPAAGYPANVGHGPEQHPHTTESLIRQSSIENLQYQEFPASRPSIERPVNHETIDRFLPSPIAVHQERPLTCEDFPILAVRCNVNERERENARRANAQPASVVAPCMSDRTQRNPSSGRTSFSQALRDRVVTRMMIQANQGEPTVRHQNPGFGLRIEVFPTGTTEAASSNHSSHYYSQPTFVNAPFNLNPLTMSYLMRDLTGAHNHNDLIHSTPSTPSPRPTERLSSDDDDCQVVAVQRTPKKPPLDVITLSSDDESLPHEDISVFGKERNSTVSKGEKTVHKPANDGDTEVETLFESLDNSIFENDLADQPGPSYRLRNRFWRQFADEECKLPSDNSNSTGSQQPSVHPKNLCDSTSTTAARVEGFSAKKMRLELSSARANPNSMPTSSHPRSRNISHEEDCQQPLEADRNTSLDVPPVVDNQMTKTVLSWFARQNCKGNDEDTSENSDSDVCTDDVTSSTTAAAAALVGMRYGNPNVNEDDFKSEFVRRSSVIRHTNLAAEFSSNSGKKTKLEGTKSGETFQLSNQTSDVDSKIPNNVYRRNVESVEVSDDSDSDIEVIYKYNGPDAYSARSEAHIVKKELKSEQCGDCLQEGEESESEDDEVTELTQSENNDVVITSQNLSATIGAGSVRGPYLSHPSPINYSVPLSDQQENGRESDEPEFIQRINDLGEEGHDQGSSNSLNLSFGHYWL